LSKADTVKSILRSWLRIEPSDEAREQGALRELLGALDRLPSEEARYLARFAYLLGRVAHADQHVSQEETRTMEELVRREGRLAPELAMLVVGLARTSNLLFGGTDNFLVARDFAAEATYAQKLALVRCLFAVSLAEGRISIAEETEIHRIARELKIEHRDLVSLRVEHRDHLPGLSNRSSPDS
jgi:uncharacterized tellurite resistance protein B-like protein